jgi:hypothetical protein
VILSVVADVAMGAVADAIADVMQAAVETASAAADADGPQCRRPIFRRSANC